MSHSNVEYSKIDNFMRNLSINAHYDPRVSWIEFLPSS